MLAVPLTNLAVLSESLYPMRLSLLICSGNNSLNIVVKAPSFHCRGPGFDPSSGK